jgi:hypothetical protein
MVDKNNILRLVGMVSTCLVCLGVGFFFGQKVKAQQNLNTSTKDDIANIAKIAKEEVKYIETPIPEVYFFKIGEDRICPKGFQVKGKFGTDAPVYYLKTNKSYDRVKPELCFVSPEKAIEKGFIEKK